MMLDVRTPKKMPVEVREPTFTELNVDLGHITLHSTVADLPNHNFQVEPDTVGQIIAAEFEKRPHLPGVIIANEQEVIGAFSRRQFLERVGRPYGVEVYLNRPVQLVIESIGRRFLMLNSDETIQQAAEKALKRPTTLFEEPIIIRYPDGRLRLINAYVLILAQSHLLSMVYQVEQNRRQLAESLERIGRELSSSLSLKKVTKRILKELFKVVAYERGLVMLQQDNYLHVLAKRGFPAELTREDLSIPIRPMEDDIFNRIVARNEPIRIGDVLAYTSWSQLDELPLNHSWLGVPLVLHERVIGMISLTRAEKNAFNEDDETLALAFASQAAVALENARLYDEITKFNEHLETMVQQRTIELNQTNAILARLDKTKSDFINVSAHELRTPITVISGYAQMLKGLPEIKENDTAVSMVTGITSGIERLHHIVNNMLDIAKIDNNTLHLHREAVDLSVLLESVCYKLQADAQARQIELDRSQLASLPAVSADPDLLSKLFRGIIINGLKYTPDGGRVEISGRAIVDVTQTYVEIAIRDTGIGIATENLELIFEKFFQTGELSVHSSGQTKFKGGGPGLGLAIAKGIVQAHNGEIWATSTGYDEEMRLGSTFFVRLPL